MFFFLEFLSQGSCKIDSLFFGVLRAIFMGYL
jgi:hypothetical protein